MPDLTIDLTGDSGDFTVSNEIGTDIRLNFPGFELDISLEQAESIFKELRPFFEGPIDD